MTAPSSTSKTSIALSKGESPIKVFRLATGTSTAVMAGIAGLSTERIEAIEAGAVGTDAELLKIARALDLPYEMLGL
jgi:DNA-binding XRE family transcriptional regulator